MANFGRVKTWGTEVLQPTDLNAEFDNIINNITSGGVDADNIDLTDVYAWSGAHTFAGTVGITGVTTHGGNVVSDTDSTDDLGTSSVRWANLFVDSIGDTGQDLTIAATTTNLPSGHVTDYAGADVVLTHSAGVLNVSTGALQVGGTAVSTVSLSGSTNNTIATVTGANALAGEANLTFDGNVLEIKSDAILAVGISDSATTTPSSYFVGSQKGIVSYGGDGQTSKIVIASQYVSADEQSGQLAFVLDNAGTTVDGAVTYNHASQFMSFHTAVTERMRIDSSGMVRIGNSSGGGTHKLYVAASNASDNIARFDNSSATNPYGVRFDMSGASPDNNSITFLNCVDSTTTRLFIYSDGDVANHDGTYGTISDVKFKQDIADARSYWDDFKSLQYRKFRHKADVEADPDAPYRLGLVAQEVETVFPALVPESPDPLVPIVDVDGEPVLDKDGEPTYEAQTYHKWVKSSIIEGPIMATVVQELMARVEALEAV
jgi:hypothetical protein